MGTFNAENTVNVGVQRSGGYGVRYNVMASPGGQISIQAPTVNLRRNNIASGIVLEGQASNETETSDRDSYIRIGTDDNPIDTLNIENTEMHNAVANLDRSQEYHYGGYASDNMGVEICGSAGHNSELSLQARNINISNSKIGIHMTAGGPGRTTQLRIGNSSHWVENLNLLDNNNGISLVSSASGQADIYARNFHITTRPSGAYTLGSTINSSEYGMITDKGVTTNIHTGTGGSGLRIEGSGRRGIGNTAIGMYAHDLNASTNIKEGDVLISNYTAGIYAISGGQINFGYNTDGSQGTDNASGNLTISDSNRGIVSLNYGSDAGNPAASVNLHVHDLYLNQNIDTPIIAGGLGGDYTGLAGNVSIRTDGTAYIQSSDIYRNAAVANYGIGSVSINTGGNGDTQLTGIIENRNIGHTSLSFNSTGSLFDGNAFNRDNRGTLDVTIWNGGRWLLSNLSSSGIYDSSISTLSVHDNGMVDLSHNGDTARRQSHHTLAAENLNNGNGTAGNLVFGTDLAASRAENTVQGHSDQLIINVSSTGRYNVMINDHSQTNGTPVQDGYVLLVRDLSSNHEAQFLGDAHIQNGGIFLRDVEITDEAPAASDGYTDVPASGRNWYARLNGPIHSDTPSGPPPLSPNGWNNVHFASGRYANLFLEEDTLRKRIGDLREGKDRGIWVRMYRGEVTADGMGGDMTYNTYQIGFDHEIKKTEDSIQYAGISYHHRDMNYNVSGFTHDSEGDADVGSLYWTKLKNDGQYLDVVGRFGRMKGKMDTYGEFPERGRWSSPYQGLSVEYGKQFKKENGWYLEPQAQLTYSHLSRGSYTTTQGTHASLSSINSLIGRIGMTFGRKTQSGDYYGMLFWHHEFDGNASYHFLDKNGDTLDGHHDYGGTWLTVGVGGEYRPSDKFTIYADVQKSFGGDVRQKWVWNAGMRWNF